MEVLPRAQGAFVKSPNRPQEEIGSTACLLPVTSINILITTLLATILSSSSAKATPETHQLDTKQLPPSYTTPTKKVERPDHPKFIDDLDYAWMDIALDRQIVRLRQKPLNGTIKMGGEVYPERQMLSSLLLFKILIKEAKICIDQISAPAENCHLELSQKISQKFNIYKPDLNTNDPRHRAERQAFFTAYNTPTIEVSRTKTSYFSHGIYSTPTSERLRRLTRVQIDFERQLESTDNDIFYAHDLFELYLLHIQGGGRVVVDDQNGKQTSYYLSFDGTNSRRFQWISKYMADQGMINSANRSVYAQRIYLRDHPEKQREIYASCPSYVYFKITEHPPIGSDNVPLTDNRSIATDRKKYKAKGLLSFIIARRPIPGQIISQHPSSIEYQNFSRFFIDQDTGGAIKGKARADLYFGEGQYSHLAGENIKEFGDIFFLMKK